MKKLSKKVKIISTILILFIGFLIFAIYENTNIETTKLDYINAKIPKEFNGFVVCQISDLHNTEFGGNQKTILDKIEQCNLI